MKNKKDLKELEPQFRSFEVREVNSEERTVELSFSSEEPYERWWGIEVLDHKKSSINMERLNNSAPLLFNHDRDEVIGVVESASIKDKRGHAVVRFGNSAKAKEVFSDVSDGIMKNVSVGYQINEMKMESEKDDVETYRVTDWQPFEISIVSIPADNSVGVGRSSDLEKNNVKILNLKEEVKMAEEIKTEIKNDNIEATKEAIKEERSRIAEITAIGAAHGLTDVAKREIENGGSIANFKSLALDEIAKQQKSIQTVSSVPTIGMDKDEVQKYSFAKALRALANPQDAMAQKDAGYEIEVSREAQKRSGVVSQGILVPFDVFQKDLTVANTSGVTVDTSMGGLIDLLRNKSAVMQLAEVLPGLNGNISFPKQTAATTVNELGETEENTLSDIGLDELVMSPKRFGGASSYSKQLIHQSSVAIENLIKNDLFSQIGLKIDKKAVETILAETGIGLVDIGTNGGAITNGHMVDLETEVAVDNADMGRLAYLLNARTRGYLKKTPITTGNPKMILDGNDLNGYPYTTSNQIPSDITKGTGTDLSAMIFGNFADLLVGMWGGVDLVVDPYTLARFGKIQVTADQFSDIGVRNAASFAVLKDGKVS